MSENSAHFVPEGSMFVQVILPIAIPKPYTYFVPEKLVEEVQFGVRVEVQFGKSKLYTGLVVDITDQPPPTSRPKAIISVVDKKPIITVQQFRLWKWMSQYYRCTLGEIMNAALPANLKLTSETKITLSPMFDDDFSMLNDQEYLIAEALSIQEEISIDDVQQILGKKTVYPLIRSLLDKHIIYLKEDLKTKYKPKKVACIRWKEPFASQADLVGDAFEKVSRSQRQTDALLAFIQLDRMQEVVRKQDIYTKANVDSNVISAMVKKGIFET